MGAGPRPVWSGSAPAGRCGADLVRSDDLGGQVPGELAGAGPALVGIAIAVLAVALWLVPSSFSSGAPKVFGLAGGLAAVASLWVRDRFGHPLPPFGPGRVAVVLGGIALVAAWIGTEWTLETRSRWEAVRKRARRRGVRPSG